MLKKLMLLLFKFMPCMQILGMIFNNTMYCFYDSDYVYILDYLIGNSVITTILLLVISKVFYFCNWHRTIIIGNFVNITIANIDAVYGIPINDIELLSIYYIISIITIAIATYNHIKHGHNNQPKAETS